jgi:hypothetical protein
MQDLQVYRRFTLNRFAEDGGGPLAELPLPFGNLIRMHLKTLRQLGKCLVPGHRR